MAAGIGVMELLKYIVTGYLIVSGISAIGNVVGSITGQNPTAQTVNTILQTMIPVMVTLMPVAMVMNLMMSMIQSLMAPFTMITRLVAPVPVTPFH